MPRRNDDSVANCDLCGRLSPVGHPTKSGVSVNRCGGYACRDCWDWAERTHPLCPECGKPYLWGDDADMCACWPLPAGMKRPGGYRKRGDTTP